MIARSRTSNTAVPPFLTAQRWLLLSALLLSPNLAASAEATAKAPPPVATPQRTFDTPRTAADALIAAAADYDVSALKEILGPGSEDLVVTEDPVQDRARDAAFAARARQKSEIVMDGKNPHRATLIIGDEDWPVPTPIVRKGGRWSFDAKAGRQEILWRRIGGNELDAIEVCRGFVEAQREYASEKHDGSSVNQYAQRIIGTPGSRTAWHGETRTGRGAGPWARGSPASSRRDTPLNTSRITAITSRS